MTERAIRWSERGELRWTLTKWWRRLRYGDSCGYLIAGRWPCGVESWLNPPRYHREWVGHDWVRRAGEGASREGRDG